MSAPVADRTRTRRPAVSVGWQRAASAPSTTTGSPARRIPAQRGSVTVPAPRRGSGAAKAAYARRDQRTKRLVGAPRRTAPRAGTGGRAQFVLLIMALLATGLVLTLWLSTAAAADSYALQDARTAARDLTERSERLHREVAAMESAPALARRATELGMVPVQDPARLVVGPDGAVTVVGEPSAATRPPAPAPAAPAMPAQSPPESQLAADAGAQRDAEGGGAAEEPVPGAAQEQQAAQAPASTGGGAG
ncbi:hypothetical protein ACL02T_11440 [Pseudonocardia sp. RS010]|uniref:hypothetical protein n=1 Tax=Pseudonocardia sp. RS010 TaxID=3385979 RepID=UPI00399F079D